MSRQRILMVALSTVVLLTGISLANSLAAEHSVARQWNEELLGAIRNDFARPTVHARNLYHASVAMWDAWAAYEPVADAVLHSESASAADIESARHETISYAAFRLLTHRFLESPGNDPEDPNNPNNTTNRLRQRMQDLGYDPDFNNATLNNPASLGVRIANTVMQFGLNDGANEQNGYTNRFYEPVNPPLDLDEVGNFDIIDPSRWQPLKRAAGFVDQSGNQVGQARSFLSAEWGLVVPFSLTAAMLDIYPTDSEYSHWVYLDPGPPPMLGEGGDADQYRSTFRTVIEFSSMLTPDDGAMIDISPASLGNNSLGANDGTGYDVNPATGQPYEPQLVRRGDFFRVIAEYWADGPASETPPGHWFSLLNEINDDPALERRLGGVGPELDALEWDVKVYLALGGAMHDAAISAWSVKGFYNYVRPISAIRFMAEMGQSSDSGAGSYHPDGLPLDDGLIELITIDSSAHGERHEHLADFIGEIAIRSWLGHVEEPESSYAGVGWIRGKEWWPYQQIDFVTPPFAGFVSGHSTFSRAAAEVLSRLTGSEYFPGGLHEFCIAQNTYLEFELGPSADLCLQWARYYDAADQSAVSRIYGGIHPPADDFPGRLMGALAGEAAVNRALAHFNGHIRPIFSDRFTD